MRIAAPYHEGELATQERAGETETARRNGRVISDSIIEGALPFIEQRSLIVVGSRDREGRVWASFVVGEPGFMKPDGDQAIEIDLAQAHIQASDPLWSNLAADEQVGAVIIDLATRRRLRVNGKARPGARRLRIDVEEAYPNCTRFITSRHVAPVPSEGHATSGRTLGDEQMRIVTNADTSFVASGHPARGVDANHRGGPAGFIEVVDPLTLRMPDYTGNSMFNTLGNFTVWPHAGLAIPDFERGRLLQIVGRPEIHWDVDDAAEATGGTRRLWSLHIDRWIDAPMSLRS